MMREKVKERIKADIGRKLKFKYNGARNQIEEFDGYIENAYSSVFTIKINNDNTFLKTFSYSDVLTETLQIFDK